MSLTARDMGKSTLPDLIAPDEASWHAMSPAQRSAYLDRLIDALEERHDVMSEGRPHSRAKSNAMDTLGRYFRRIGRRIYLATELPVLYPGQPIVTPDLMAVLDVDESGEDDERTAWVVADEGKGPDLALEVHFSGDEHKDFVRNVKDYAAFGIREYFLYDRRRQMLHGYVLPSPGAREYQKVRARFGRFNSGVLGLDLQVHGGRLRFFHGDAELPDSDQLIDRIERMVEDIELRRTTAETRLEEERVRAQEERVRAEAERVRAEAERVRSAQILNELRETVLDILAARALPAGVDARSRLDTCTDAATLRRWATRAVTAATVDEAFE